MKVRTARVLLVFLFGSMLVSSGCGERGDAASAQGEQEAAAQAPPPLVDVVTAKAGPVVLTENLPGRLHASREAVIVPRISGIVLQRLFVEGAMVGAGEPLYRLDDGTYRADLRSAKASLEQAIANRDLYRATVKRYAPLVKVNAVSRQTYDEALANLKVQEANIAAAEAAIHAANIALGYAKITAPIGGRIGYSKVTEGAYVTASTTEMAKIQQLDPLYFDITQSAARSLARKKAMQGAKGRGDSGFVRLLFDDGTPYPLQGRLLFVDQTVDEATGEVTLRAQVPNPDGVLLPGQYARAIVEQARYSHAYLIPQQSVTLGKIDTVLLVKEDGSFEPCPVTILGQKDGQYVIGKGLQEGDQVIADGTSALVFGAKKVRTRPWRNPLADKGDGARKETPDASLYSVARQEKPLAAADASTGDRTDVVDDGESASKR